LSTPTELEESLANAPQAIGSLEAKDDDLQDQDQIIFQQVSAWSRWLAGLMLSPNLAGCQPSLEQLHFPAKFREFKLRALTDASMPYIRYCENDSLGLALGKFSMTATNAKL